MAISNTRIFGSTAAPTVLDAASGRLLTVPSDFPLASAGYARVGPNLVIDGANGAQVVVTDFFAVAQAPDLATPSGAVIPAGLAAKLAGPMAPGQFAQAAGEPPPAAIGEVDQVKGVADIRHATGVTDTAVKGMPVFEGDIVTTGAQGSIGLVLNDGSTFSVGNSGRMVLDQVNYDSETNTGSSTLTVTNGPFSFVSGEIAKTAPDAMTVKTPVLTIGVRGTTVAGVAAPEGGNNTVSLLADSGGKVGQIAVKSGAGIQVMSQPNQTIQLASFNQPPPPPTIMSPQQIQQLYGSATQSLPPVQPPIQQRGDLQQQQQQQQPQQVQKAAAEAKVAEAAKAGTEAKAAEAKATAAAKAASDAKAAAEKAGSEGKAAAEAKAAAAEKAAAAAKAAATAKAAEATKTAAEAKAAAQAAGVTAAEAATIAAAVASAAQAAAQAAAGDAAQAQAAANANPFAAQGNVFGAQSALAAAQAAQASLAADATFGSNAIVGQIAASAMAAALAGIGTAAGGISAADAFAQALAAAMTAVQNTALAGPVIIPQIIVNQTTTPLTTTTTVFDDTLTMTTATTAYTGGAGNTQYILAQGQWGSAGSPIHYTLTDSSSTNRLTFTDLSNSRIEVQGGPTEYFVKFYNTFGGSTTVGDLHAPKTITQIQATDPESSVTLNDLPSLSGMTGTDDRAYIVAGTTGSDTIDTSGLLNGASGAPTGVIIFGGTGNDVITPSVANNVIFGGSDTDTLTYANTAFSSGVTINVTAGSGNTVSGNASHTYASTTHNDLFYGVESLIGSAGNDTITVSLGAVPLGMDGGAGTDTLNWTYGPTNTSATLPNFETINLTGMGTFTGQISGSTDVTIAQGGAGPLILTVSNSYAIVSAAGSGNSITVSNGSHSLTSTNVGDIYLTSGGSASHLTMVNAQGSSVTFHGSSDIAEQLSLGDGTNVVTVTGIETVTGGSGADSITMTTTGSTITGGVGIDAITLLSTGGGTDVIRYAGTSDLGASPDLVKYFVSGDNLAFTGFNGTVTSGHLDAADFLSSDAATVALADKHFTYDQTNHVLTYDADANHSTSNSVQVAAIHADTGTTAATIDATHILMA